MATQYHHLSDYDAETLPERSVIEEQRYAIVVADWNPEVTFALCEGAISTLEKEGVKKENVHVFHVPGTFELTYAASVLQKQMLFDAIIVIGCVVQGDTPHFTFVCQGVTQGITQLNVDAVCPIIFSVLTTDTMQQALDRAGGSLGNKGVEGAITAIKMANLFGE